MPDVLTPPEDLPTEQLTSHLRTHWGLTGVEVSYAPLGHGSHNWRVVEPDGTRWFAKAGRSGPDSDFSQTTSRTAAALREAGLDFVLAPVRDLAGAVRPRVTPDWEISLFPFIDGRNPDFDSHERVLVGAVLGCLHAHRPLPDGAIRWEPGWYQPELKQVLADELDRPWDEGPYGERARALFVKERAGIQSLLAHSDRLVAQLEESEEPWVMTHGEPHAGNTMLDSTGRMHLVDCDALMVAPPERDLRVLLHGDHRGPRDLDNTDVVAAYRRGAGPVEPRPFALELFRAEWHLIEICRYAWLFSGSHGDTADVRVRWEALSAYVPVSQNWSEPASG